MRAVYQLASARCKRCGKRPEFVVVVGKAAEFYCTPDMPMSALADVAAQEGRAGR